MTDLRQMIVDLAVLERDMLKDNSMVQAAINELEQQYIAPLREQLAANNKALEDAREAVKVAAKEHYSATGERKLNDWIEVSKKPTTFVYDEKAVLESLKAENQTQFIRVKEEINKIELNKALRNNELPWLDVQRVEDVTVSIRPLGEVLVQIEAQS